VAAVGVGQAHHEIGVAGQGGAEQPTGPEQHAEALRGLGRLAEGLDQRGLALRAGQQVAQLQQPEIGIG
jgi:hypothetical protein